MPDPTLRYQQLLKALHSDDATAAPSASPLLVRPPRAPDVALPRQGPLGLFDKVAALLSGAIGVNEPDPADYLTTDNYQQAMRYHGVGQLGSLAAGPIIGGAKELTTSAEEAIPKMIKAFHGSPYDFNAFDASKIGSGEGGQAYSYGHYFAERPETAGTYKFSNKPDPHLVNPTGQIPEDVQHALDSVGRLGFDTHAEALNAVRANPLKWREAWDVGGADQAAADVIEKYVTQYPRGRLYEVNIHADPETFLDWDKPFSQQSPQVQAAIKAKFPQVIVPNTGQVQGDMTGKELYSTIRSLQNDTPSVANAETLGARVLAKKAGASQALKDAGIVGTKFLDQGSRQVGEGTRNLVVYPGNEHLIEIMKKYGVALPVAAEIFRRQQQTTAEASTPQQ